MCHLDVGVSWLSFLIEVKIFLVFCVISDFLLYPGQFGYYIMRLWCFSRPTMTPCQWGSTSLLLDGMEEIGEVQVLCLAPIDTLGSIGALLLLSRAWCLRSPVAFLWYFPGWQGKGPLVTISHVASNNTILSNGKSHNFPLGLYWQYLDTSPGIGGELKVTLWQWKSRLSAWSPLTSWGRRRPWYHQGNEISSSLSSFPWYYLGMARGGWGPLLQLDECRSLGSLLSLCW